MKGQSARLTAIRRRGAFWYGRRRYGIEELAAGGGSKGGEGMNRQVNEVSLAGT